MTTQQTLALRLAVIEGLLPLATGDYAAALRRECDELRAQLAALRLVAEAP